MSLGKYNYKLQFCSCEGMYFKGRVYNSKISHKSNFELTLTQVCLAKPNFESAVSMVIESSLLSSDPKSKSRLAGGKGLI